MKLIYLTVDGRARIESANIRARMVEEPDGYHPLTNDSVWQDSKRRREPVLVLTEGVLGPYGSSMAEEDILHLLFDIDLAERAFKLQSVSKMWQRSIAAAIAWLGRSLPYLFIISIIAYAVYTTYFGGA
jgi:hypothetical protein